MPDFIETWLKKPVSRFLNNELTRRILKNTGYLFSATGISAALSMVQGILTARLLGVTEFGILGVITMSTSVLNKLVSFRMGELVVKYVGEFIEKDDQRSAAAIFKIGAFFEMLASLVAFGLVCLLAPLSARYLAKDASTTNYFIIYGLIVIANLISESSIGLLQILDRFRRMAALNVLQSAVTLAFIGIAFVSNKGLLEVLLAYLIGKIVGALGLAVAALQEATRNWEKGWWRVPISRLWPMRRELANFAFSTNISATISLITKDSELLWVSYFRNPLETGYYKLALSLSNIVQMPISPMPQATYPELSREAARQNWANVRYTLRQGSFVAGGYTVAAIIGLILFGEPLIRLVYTPEFLPAFSALLILMVGLIFANTFYWRRIALLALGRPDYPAKINAILAVLKVIAAFLLVPKFGYLVSAALLSFFYCANSILSVWKVRSLIPKNG